MDYFYELTEYRFAEQIANEDRQRKENEAVKEQKDKPKVSTLGGDNEDVIKTEDDQPERRVIEWNKGRFSENDFKGATIEWVRAKVSQLPDRREVARC